MVYKNNQSGKMTKDTRLRYDEAMALFSVCLDEDLEQTIETAFQKLDISNNGELSVKLIRQGLVLNNRTHISPLLKELHK